MTNPISSSKPQAEIIPLPLLPRGVWQKTFTHLPIEGLNAVLLVCRQFSELAIAERDRRCIPEIFQRLCSSGTYKYSSVPGRWKVPREWELAGLGGFGKIFVKDCDYQNVGFYLHRTADRAVVWNYGRHFSTDYVKCSALVENTQYQGSYFLSENDLVVCNSSGCLFHWEVVEKQLVFRSKSQFPHWEEGDWFDAIREDDILLCSKKNTKGKTIYAYSLSAREEGQLYGPLLYIIQLADKRCVIFGPDSNVIKETPFAFELDVNKVYIKEKWVMLAMKGEKQIFAFLNLYTGQCVSSYEPPEGMAAEVTLCTRGFARIALKDKNFNPKNFEEEAKGPKLEYLLWYVPTGKVVCYDTQGAIFHLDIEKVEVRMTSPQQILIEEKLSNFMKSATFTISVPEQLPSDPPPAAADAPVGPPGLPPWGAPPPVVPIAPPVPPVTQRFFARILNAFRSFWNWLKSWF